MSLEDPETKEASEVAQSADAPIVPFRKHYWKVLGPGLTTGAADDDPSGIATYSQMGAQNGFGLAWLAAFLLPMMATVQEMCARIGLSTGAGLAYNIKRHYSRKVLLASTFLLLLANVFNIGADLGAMAKAAELLVPQANFVLLVFFFALFSLVLQVFIPYRKYSKYLKYLSFVLVAYILSAISIRMDWPFVLKSAIIPSVDFSKSTIILIAAAFGTTISPYLFFWQTSQEIEEEIERGETSIKSRKAGNTPEKIKDMREDVWSGMIFSNLIMFFIIIACGAALFPYGITNINTAAEAAEALRPFAGDFAYLLFALGIVGTGLLAIPVLAASASYAISESFGWKFGLNRKFKQAASFYGVIIFSMALGIALNFIGLPSIQALIYSAVLNGIVSPVVLFFILRISASEKIMGQFKNKPLGNIFGWITFLAATVLSALSIYFLIW